jgi:hypothetical protein
VADNGYHFVTNWRVRASVEEVTAILFDAAALPRWWPSVYLEVQVLDPGDARGVGSLVSLYTKGWLPYTLRWNARTVEVTENTLTLVPEGDFAGRGIWSFAQDGEWALISYDWKITAEKPLLRYLTPLLRAVFAANHEWAMRMGERSLRLELERRRARTPEEAARIAPPPGPTTTSPWPLVLALVGSLVAFAWLGIALWGWMRALRRGHSLR